MDDIEKLTKGEETINAVLHGIGLGLAIAALVILVVLANMLGGTWHIISFSIYGSTLIILYLASTLYHSFPHGKAKKIFRIIDHSAIYLLIAGTYTPVTLICLRDKLGWAIFITVWVIAIGGIVFELIPARKNKVVSAVLYIIMGWLVIIAIKPLLLTMNQASMLFLVLGGVLYTVGAVFYVARQIKYHHAIWHLFVLVASICHFFTMLFLLLK